MCNRLTQEWRKSTQMVPIVKDETFSEILTHLCHKVSRFLWKRMQKNLMDSKKYICELYLADNHYRVRRSTPECRTFRDVIYINSSYSCPCNELIYMGVPCKHILCVLISTNCVTNELVFSLIATFWILDEVNCLYIPPRTVNTIPCLSMNMNAEKHKRVRELTDLANDLANNSSSIEKLCETEAGFKIACKLLKSLHEI